MIRKTAKKRASKKTAKPSERPLPKYLQNNMPKKGVINSNDEIEEIEEKSVPARKGVKKMTGSFIPKIKKNLTLPVLTTALETPYYFTINEKLRIAKPIGDKPEAIIAMITNLETGEEMMLLCPAVMQSILHDTQGAPLFGQKEKGAPVEELEPGDENPAYIGKGFMLIKHKKPSGKNYNPISMSELELDE
jgi:hypothetical protein